MRRTITTITGTTAAALLLAATAYAAVIRTAVPACL
jgi:hypothetical protein